MKKPKMRRKNSWRRKAGKALSLLLCFILGLLLALQMKNVADLKSLNLLGNDSVESLQEQVRSLSVANNELQARNASLNANLEELVRLGNDDNAQINFYRQQMESLSVFAGLTPVKGPGLIIDINLTQPGANISASNLLVIKNALNGAGANAISINDQRVVATTDIANTGSDAHPNIIMNGTGITSDSHYEIRVIGEERKLKDFVDFHTPIWDHLKQAGCTVSFSFPEEVEIPALAKDSPAFRQQLLEPVPTP